MCAQFLQSQHERKHGWLYNAERALLRLDAVESTTRTLTVVLRHPAVHAGGHARSPSALNVYLYIIVPKGFFPQQDTGRLKGSIVGDQDISFPGHASRSLTQFIEHRRSRSRGRSRRRASPAAARANRGSMFIQLKAARASARSAPTQVIAGCARSCSASPAPRSSCRPRRISASAAAAATRSTSTRCGATISTISTTGRRSMLDADADTSPTSPTSTPTSRTRACRPSLVIDRDTASRLGISAAADRQHALRRLRPAPGLHHVHVAQPVSRRDGSRRRSSGRTPTR